MHNIIIKYIFVTRRIVYAILIQQSDAIPVR